MRLPRKKYLELVRRNDHHKMMAFKAQDEIFEMLSKHSVVDKQTLDDHYHEKNYEEAMVEGFPDTLDAGILWANAEYAEDCT